MGNTTVPGLQPMAFPLDTYGNPVNYEPLLGFAVGGLLTLKAWVGKEPVRQAQVDRNFWLESASRVASARSSMEVAFRKIGNGVEALLSANSHCVRQARASIHAGLWQLDDHQKDKISCLVASAELCRKALLFGELGTDRSLQIRSDLNELERMSSHILRTANEIKEHMRPAEVVQVLLRIECARLDEIARAPLEALSVEIARTCEKMALTMELEFRLVAETHKSVVKMIDHVRNLELRQNAAAARRQELAREIDVFHKQSLEQASKDEALNVISAGLDKSVSSVIGALQYQDIVGQRWEHIEQGLSALAGSHENTAKDADETAFNAILQNAQLSEANSEMAAALCRIDESLLQVGAALSRLGDEVNLALQDTGRQMLTARMHDVLLEVWEMVKSHTAQMETADELIAPLIHVAGEMGCQIGQVSHEMRLIALNAQVQAARFGESTGLEVLAEALCSIADQIGTSGSVLESDSRSIEQISSKLRDSFSELHEQATQVCFECENGFPPALDQLSTHEERSKGFLKAAREGCESLNIVRGEMQKNLAEAVLPVEDLFNLALSGKRFVDSHYQRDTKVDHMLKEKLLEAESARYTMASEKEILMNIADGKKPEGQVDEIKGFADGPGDIELF